MSASPSCPAPTGRLSFRSGATDHRGEPGSGFCNHTSSLHAAASQLVLPWGGACSTRSATQSPSRSTCALALGEAGITGATDSSRAIDSPSTLAPPAAPPANPGRASRILRSSVCAERVAGARREPEAREPRRFSSGVPRVARASAAPTDDDAPTATPTTRSATPTPSATPTRSTALTPSTAPTPRATPSTSPAV
eukprot:scaffold3050_cov99-Isochrysis_galbana.AAC.4